MISFQKLRVLVLTVLTALSGGMGFLDEAIAQNTKRLNPSEVLPRLKPEADPLFKDLFKGYYERDGKLFYDVKNDGNQNNDELVAYVNVIVTGYTTDGRELYDVRGWEPVNVAQSDSILITEFSDGGILKYDPDTGRLLYKAPGGDGIYEVVNADLLARYPNLRGLLEGLGFRFSTRDDGSMIIIDDGDRLGNGPGTEIIISSGSRGRRPGGGGSDSISIYDDGTGFGDDDISIRDRSRRGPGGGRDSIRVRDGGGFGDDSFGFDDSIYADDGMGRDYGESEFTFSGPNGGRLRIRVSDADIIDSEKIDKMVKEFQIGNQTYAIVKIDIPGWFNDESVILRKGKNGEWYLISQAEHAFIMDTVRNDPKYKEVYDTMKSYEVDTFDSGDYEIVRKHALKYPNSRAPRGGATIIEYPAGYDDFSDLDRISVRDGRGRDGSRDSIEVFIDEYLRSHPNASLAEIQAALNKRFGDDSVIISDAPGGKYRIKYGPNGANGDDSVSFIIGEDGYGPDGGSDSVSIRDGGGRNPGGRDSVRIRNGGGLDSLDVMDLDSIIDGMFSGAGRGGSGSTNIKISGSAPAFAPKREKAEIIQMSDGSYKVRIPILQPSGAYTYAYEDIDGPNDAAGLARIMAKYADKGVDFSSISTTAPGNNPGKQPGGNTPTVPDTQKPSHSSYEVLFQEAVENLINVELKAGNSVEITHVAGRVKNSAGVTTRTFMTPLKQPYAVTEPDQIDDLLNGIEEKNKTRNGG